VKNSTDNVFEGIPVGAGEGDLFNRFLAAHDLSANSRRAFVQDRRMFARWFTCAKNTRDYLLQRSAARGSLNSPSECFARPVKLE
jgi:hypothetical protein